MTLCCLDSLQKPANSAIDRTNVTSRILRAFAVRTVCTRKSCRLELILTRCVDKKEASPSVTEVTAPHLQKGHTFLQPVARSIILTSAYAKSFILPVQVFPERTKRQGCSGQVSPGPQLINYLAVVYSRRRFYLVVCALLVQTPLIRILALRGHAPSSLYRRAALRLCNLVAPGTGDAQRAVQAGSRKGTDWKGTRAVGGDLFQTITAGRIVPSRQRAGTGIPSEMGGLKSILPGSGQ